MRVEQEIAADLAAAAAAAGPGEEVEATACASETKGDATVGLKHERDENGDVAPSAGLEVEQKRLRVH
jgi:hypothetical protein